MHILNSISQTCYQTLNHNGDLDEAYSGMVCQINQTLDSLVKWAAKYPDVAEAMMRAIFALVDRVFPHASTLALATSILKKLEQEMSQASKGKMTLTAAQKQQIEKIVQRIFTVGNDASQPFTLDEVAQIREMVTEFKDASFVTQISRIG